MNLKEQIDRHSLPRHVAMIMDGNGRWAEKKGVERIFGHRNGVESVRQVVEAAGELGVEYLTLGFTGSDAIRFFHRELEPAPDRDRWVDDPSYPFHYQ